MTLMRRVLLLAILLLGLSSPSFCQVATGTPPFSAIASGPADSINLANLDVHVDVPVLQKAGRGVPFSYDITYDSSPWAPPSVTGNSTWAPYGPPNWSFGWFSQCRAEYR